MSGAMTLLEWRTSERLSQVQTAALLTSFLGRVVHAPSISQWENGVMPGADVAEAVRIMTDGKVTGASFKRPECPSA